MPEPYCVVCENKGRPKGCLVCKKQTQKKPKRQRFDFSSRFSRRGAQTPEDHVNMERARLEVVELWKEATYDLWLSNRRKYMELVKEIKRKESRYL